MNALERAERPAVPVVTSASSDALMQLIERVVLDPQADVAKLEKLLELRERWEKNQARKEFDTAIAAAKSKLTPVLRSATGHNNKKYADFASIARAVDPILSAEGLGYRFRTHQDERIHITCILFHREGHSEENTLAGPADQTGSKNPIQAIGSTQSYLMRYSLCGALGIATANDDDGRTACPVSPLSDAQAEQIRSLLTETKSDVSRFLKWVNAESVSDIASTKFQDCIALLQAKKNKAAP